MTRGRNWPSIGGNLAIIVGLVAVAGVGVRLTSDARLVGPGARAPYFEAVSLATGETVTMADYTGEALLLNIWATWCAPCEAEMPSIQRLHETLGPKGLKIVAVSIDDTDPEEVFKWVTERGLTFEIVQDRSMSIERDYQTTGVPETFVIGRDGVILRKEIGAREWDTADQVATLRRILRIE